MSQDFELRYKVEVDGDNQLSSLGAKQREISLGAKYSADAIRGFETVLKAAMSSGMGYKAALDSISKSTQGIAGEASKLANELLKTGAASSSTASALGQADSAAKKTTASFTEARYSAQLLGRELGVPIPRALSSIASQASGLGPILQKAFPIVAAVGFGQVLAEIIEKLIEWKSGLKDIVEFNETIGKTLEEQSRKVQDLSKESQEAQLRLLGATKGKAAEDLARVGLLGKAIDTDRKNISSLEAQVVSLQQRLRKESSAGIGSAPLAIPNPFGGAPFILGGNKNIGASKEFTSTQNELKQVLGQLAVTRAQYTRDNTTAAADKAQSLKETKPPKVDTKGIRAVQREDEYLAELQDRAYREQNPGIFRPVGELEEQRARRLRQIANDQDLTAGKKRTYTSQFSSLYGQDISDEKNRIGETMRETESRFNSESSKDAIKGIRATMKDQSFDLRQSLEQYTKQQANVRSNVQTDIGFQSGVVQRQYGLSGQLRTISGDNTPNLQYSDQMQMAQQLLQLKMKEIALEDDGDKRQMDSKKALYDYIAEQDQARITREEQIAQIAQQQKEESGQFFTGLFRAGLSGMGAHGAVNPVGSYLRGFGQDIAGKLVGNVAQETVGSLQSRVGLGGTGLMGTPDNRSFLGKVFQGTPLDFSAEQMKKAAQESDLKTASQNPVKLSTDANTTATIENTAALRSLLGSIGSAGGPGSAYVPSGSGGGGGMLGMGDLPMAASMPFSLPGVSAGSVPSDGSGIYSSINGGMPIAKGPGFTLPGITASGGSASGTAGKLSSTLGQLLGGAKYTTSGYGLGALLHGAGDMGNGVGAALSGTERLGLGLGMGGAAATGVLGALSGFKQGGGRGDIKGIASAAEGIAPFSGPAAPFLEAGGALLGLVSSLFPDPRQERIKAEQKNLVSQAFIKPLAHDYSFSASGNGGFGFSEGGGMSTGAPTATHSYTINAIDSQSFYDALQKNPQQFSQALLTGIQAGGVQSIGNAMAYAADYGGF